MRRTALCASLAVAGAFGRVDGMALAAELLQQKAALRKSIRSAFAESSEVAIGELSAVVCHKVLELEAVRRARGVCAYLSMPKELQTRELLEGLFSERYDAATLEEAQADEKERLVCVPKVTGRERFDMLMVPITGELIGRGCRPSKAARFAGGFEEIRSFPRNRWNIPEPVVEPDVDREQLLGRLAPLLDVVVVPGVAFDRKCRRLGHGKGYYDTFLQSLTDARAALELPPPLKIGVGLDFQLVEEIPTEEHDQVLDAVVTPEESFTSGEFELAR
eukprot:scaffold825_cov249-Pinguiococcus_pyrenoidosus.AAC.2